MRKEAEMKVLNNSVPHTAVMQQVHSKHTQRLILDLSSPVVGL